MHRSRRVQIRPLVALALGLQLAGAAHATQKDPKVTNGGYMQTQTADGKSVALPLKHTDVEAEVAGMVTSVQVTQHFHNPYKKPIEAVYVFPLPHKAAIYAMTIKVGKRVIKGVVKKRQEARQIYERAKAQGKTAALLEQERPNIFTQSISNIMPGDQIRVMIRYNEALEPQSGRYEFSFPMVVGPRYVGGGEALGTRKGSGWGTDTTRIPDASRITPRLLAKGLRPGNDIAVKLRINGGVKVRHLQVVAHRAEVSHDAQGASVVLARSDSVPNKDFVVRYQLSGQRPEVAVLTQRDKRGGHFMLMIQPKAKMQQSDIAPREYVFVVDNSGSMSGFPVQQARAVVSRSLNNLKRGDTFQIIKFAGYPDQFAAKAVRATPKNVQNGIQYVSQMRGGGGTEFIPALRLALTSKKDPQRSRIVLFITDGYIGYERQVLRFLRENAKGINVFSMGVGSSVNRFLIDGMARIGVGSPFYLLNTEKASSVVERIFATISKPALTSIDIDWGGLDVEELTPAAIPDLFGEKPVFVVGRFKKGGKGTVTVRGRLAGRRFAQRVSVDLPRSATGANAAVAYLWARRRIGDSMDILATEPNRAKEMEKSVTKLALNYNLMSKFTSFVAVDHRIRNQGGQQVTVPVPVPLPQGVSPAAAPANAYVGGGYGRGAGAMRYATKAKARRYRRPAQRSVRRRVGKRDSLDDLIDGSLGSRGSTRPRPVRSPSPVAVAAEKSKAKPAEDRKRAPRVRLRGNVRVSGSANSARVKAALSNFVRRLGRQLKSVSGGTSGTLKIRLSLDASGRVTRIAFISGSLMLPSLKAELARLVRTWRFGVLPEATTVVFTLRFS
jgi:Ca-activated chloride channel family protein